jgi:serine/threonine protein kinase
MPQTRTCPFGHRWEGDGPAGQHCPVCASAGASSDGSRPATAAGAADELPPLPDTATAWRPEAPTAGAGPESPRRLPTIPGYEVLGEVGRGGMGVVYEARHLGLKRAVALKVIRAGEYAHPQELARFRAEAEAVARLQHPNIVQVYEIGGHHGLPFFSLEFCAGGSLARRLDGRPLPPGRAAELVEALARAVAAAHRAAVIHRDLKPANVLFTADGTPKVTDFGLAKRLDETRLTATGAVMGTPSYMAPEQARGDVTAVGPAADVYALGAILYECLTGRPPFTGDTAHAIISQVIGREPDPPSRRGPKVPRDLDVVCLKCLEKEPARRYASEMLQEVPVDPYDGSPLRYRRRPEGVTVYAVGPDGRDDGGKLDTVNAGRDGTDVGFQLWDVARRQQSAPMREPSGQ